MFTKSTYLIKERVGLLKLVDTYDIYDAETGKQIGIAEEKPGLLITILRLIVNKRLLPTKVFIAPAPNQPPVLAITRGMSLLRSKVLVKAGTRTLGYFKSKLFSFGGGFYVFNQSDKQIAEIQGDWKGWNFKFLDGSNKELGTVTKKWAGLGKELFTSADNYVVNVVAGQPQDTTSLLLAAGIAIDTVYKEK